MGTSGSSRGPGSATPLVPSWLDDTPTDPLPGNDIGAAPAHANASLDADADNGTSRPAQLPAIPPAPAPARFQSARRNFSSFARSGGSDRPALRRAVRDYVRPGTLGGRNATRGL